MSAHHDPIDKLEIILVWLPVVALCLGRWVMPNVGQAEFLIACAGWSNLVAVIAIAREFVINENRSRVELGRALAFIPVLILFPLILAWDLIHVLHENSSAYEYIIIIASCYFLFVIFYQRYAGSIPPILSSLLALSAFACFVGVVCIFLPRWEKYFTELAYLSLGTKESWWVDPIIKRFHVWTHLIIIPLIYLVTDGLQYFLVEPEGKDKKKYHAFCFYDFIMLAVGGAFTVTGWYVAFPHKPDNPNITNAIGVEEVAASAILVLWNIAYVHLYPSASMTNDNQFEESPA